MTSLLCRARSAGAGMRGGNTGAGRGGVTAHLRLEHARRTSLDKGHRLRQAPTWFLHLGLHRTLIGRGADPPICISHGHAPWNPPPFACLCSSSSIVLRGASPLINHDVYNHEELPIASSWRKLHQNLAKSPGRTPSGAGTDDRLNGTPL
eukprot:2734359-Prymnesium_polylepis.1